MAKGLGACGHPSTRQPSLRLAAQDEGHQSPSDQRIVASRTASAQARWGKVEELQGAAIFLASDASSFVNGNILFVDGGMTAVV